MGRFMKDLEKIENVCTNLENENKGFGARLDFWCCQTCGHAAMDNNGTKQYIFAHEQSMDSAFEPVMETEYYDEDGGVCDYTDDYVESEDHRVGRESYLSKSGLYFHHHIEDEALKKAVVKAFNDAGFLVEWDLSDSTALKVLDV